MSSKQIAVINPPMLVEKALSFTHELSFSIHCAQQMYFGGSVIGKASTIGREISPTPP